MYWAFFAIFLSACLAAGSTGAMFPPGKWYRELSKPPWTPPNWLFPVAWTTLYLLIAGSAARVAILPGSGFALSIFALQIALNTLWTPVFFGLHRLRGGMVVLSLLWLSVVATAGAFWLLDPIAGYMLIPYIAWVTVAGALNFSVWRRNPDVRPVETPL
ncbi:tryptophan-rich sensory protein TspO [Anianabacter salinae]|uniref:tryptophan-rich sensory protein TspO n=1 Tax=Anianabacter salinae TaxID=2851023 RepID=UPI00225DDC7F|nr:TspO/MBR family protein [Anianabacter salinae]MBV0914135.1 tryptophan-rich sensory protein [Anianabacter salinae]